ncbi:VanZ family protein [Thermococcus aciditolerans]|uniref:VanZ family protein n=1 Tax=Thermococcus aciditolerans TaxID=2598455 RepID=A0A5C0SN11_9EURY|nr:VanZ family protein [Thermococcus aciditolerans]QEK15372.1 VanZ family protein [Thermococcus aciditolerans]
MRRFLFLYVLLLLFLNLTPRVPSSPVANGDKLAHLVEFAALGFLGWRLWTYLLPLPFLLEFLQLFVPGRTFSFADMCANLIGFTLGVTAGWWYDGSHEGTEVSNEGGD